MFKIAYPKPGDWTQPVPATFCLLLGMPRLRREDNINMVLSKVGCQVEDEVGYMWWVQARAEW
jgi:hypothetical protein